jgi:antirestriction protein ArdC
MKREQATKLVSEGLEQLSEALREGKSETLLRYLEVMARFHHYSFGNCMLILVQRPEATHVAGFRTWKKLGRYVKKGEQGIGILAPLVYRRKAEDDEEEGAALRGFKVVHVFDASQTDGDDLVETAGIHGDPGEKIERLEELIRGCGISLDYAPLSLGVKGASTGGRVTVQPGLAPAERFAVLTHELGHELLVHSKRHHETTKKIRETEAEAVAYVVCRAVGLDPTTRSSDYIQLHRGDSETLSESLDVIQKTAAYIVEELGKEKPAKHYASAG